MPPVIIAVVGFLIEAFGVTAALAIINFVTYSLLAIGANLVLGAISKMFTKGPGSSSLSSQLASRTVTTRQPISPWRVQYGVNRVGGIITMMHTTGATNQKLHLVITTSGHEVNSSATMYFDGV